MAEKGASFPSMRLLFLLWAACVPPGSDLPSSEVATRDLWFSVTASDDGPDLRLWLDVQGPTGPVRFGGGDAIAVQADGAPLDLEQTPEGYEAPLDDGTRALQVEVVREADHDVAFQVEVAPRLVPELQLTDEALEVSWEPVPGDYDVILAVEGDCVQYVTRPLGTNTGHYALSRAELGVAAACTVAVTLSTEITANGPLVPREQGGGYWARSWRQGRSEVAWP